MVELRYITQIVNLYDKDPDLNYVLLSNMEVHMFLTIDYKAITLKGISRKLRKKIIVKVLFK